MKHKIERVTFDPSNKTHREAYHKFLVERKWYMHFKIESPWLELPAMIDEKLLLWYMEKDSMMSYS